MMKTCRWCLWCTDEECQVIVPMVVADNLEGFFLCRTVDPDRDASSCACYEPTERGFDDGQ